MRPGHLGNLEGFWFGDLAGKYFEVLEARSAEPIYLIRDRVRGKTGEEFKAFLDRRKITSTSTPKKRMRNRYPYRDSSFPRRWDHLARSHQQAKQVFVPAPF